MKAADFTRFDVAYLHFRFWILLNNTSNGQSSVEFKSKLLYKTEAKEWKEKKICAQPNRVISTKTKTTIMEISLPSACSTNFTLKISLEFIDATYRLLCRICTLDWNSKWKKTNRRGKIVIRKQAATEREWNLYMFSIEHAFGKKKRWIFVSVVERLCSILLNHFEFVF